MHTYYIKYKYISCITVFKYNNIKLQHDKTNRSHTHDMIHQPNTDVAER